MWSAVLGGRAGQAAQREQGSDPTEGAGDRGTREVTGPASRPQALTLMGRRGDARGAGNADRRRDEKPKGREPEACRVQRRRKRSPEPERDQSPESVGSREDSPQGRRRTRAHGPRGGPPEDAPLEEPPPPSRGRRRGGREVADPARAQDPGAPDGRADRIRRREQPPRAESGARGFGGSKRPLGNRQSARKGQPRVKRPRCPRRSPRGASDTTPEGGPRGE